MDTCRENMFIEIRCCIVHFIKRNIRDTTFSAFFFFRIYYFIVVSI